MSSFLELLSEERHPFVRSFNLYSFSTMDLNFDTLLDMWNPGGRLFRPSTPTPTKICSQLKQHFLGSGQYSTFVKRTTVYYRCAEKPLKFTTRTIPM
ncbi:hypothetical protein TNIN_419491 [Trichonephila inaurata madagascariensis]|uniref:Uncharacterized protein n=1 Tax=Trichonephila inaurata madagascariensis TaxID=2747483 RepID=A0A8X6WTZ1_9ARAC|nr:hypothetical protein TNIN_419491 [Trichonephila inaurata madagascariensis]